MIDRRYTHSGDVYRAHALGISGDIYAPVPRHPGVDDTVRTQKLIAILEEKVATFAADSLVPSARLDKIRKLEDALKQSRDDTGYWFRVAVFLGAAIAWNILYLAIGWIL